MGTLVSLASEFPSQPWGKKTSLRNSHTRNFPNSFQLGLKTGISESQEKQKQINQTKPTTSKKKIHILDFVASLKAQKER